MVQAVAAAEHQGGGGHRRRGHGGRPKLEKSSLEDTEHSVSQVCSMRVLTDYNQPRHTRSTGAFSYVHLAVGQTVPVVCVHVGTRRRDKEAHHNPEW